MTPHLRPSRPRQAITAAELARRKGVDDRTVRRWRKAGCPVVRRGKQGHSAPMFDERAVDAWLQKNDTEERRMVGSLIDVTDARARRTRNDLLRLQGQYVDPREVADVIWPLFVAYVRAHATAIIAPLAERLATVVTAPPAPPPPPADRRFLTADDIRVLLTGDPAARPWKPPAAPGIENLAARGLGIELTSAGSWFEWNPAAVVPVPTIKPEHAVASEIKRTVYELLTALSRAEIPVANSKPVAPPPVVKSSATLRSARAQLAEIQTRMVTLRDAIASGTLTRDDDVVHEYQSRVSASKTYFLTLQTAAPACVRAALTGEGTDEICKALTRIVAEAIRELEPRKHQQETTR